MATIKMEELSVASVKQMMGHGSFIGDDLLLFESLTKLPWPNSPRRMKCVLLAMCMKGKAQYSVDTEEHMVKGGDVIIINVMGYDFFSDVIKGIHELSSLFLFSRMHPVFSLTKEEQFAIQAYFRAIKYRVDDTGHHFRIDVVRSLIMTMIYDISNAIYRLQQTNDHRQTRAEAIFAKFIKLVEENFRQERRVSWYGEKLCITPKYLSETVKAVSHRTPNEWIDNYVILEARVLLKNSTMSIKQISQHLNFPNQSFLGKYFKEHVGMSPSEYRQS